MNGATSTCHFAVVYFHDISEDGIFMRQSASKMASTTSKGQNETHPAVPCPSTGLALLPLKQRLATTKPPAQPPICLRKINIKHQTQENFRNI